MFKKIIPFENLIYHSSLSKEELLLHLQNQIESKKSFGFGSFKHSYSKSYIGKIYNDSFEIKRAINYRNSFLPLIKGHVKNDLTGSKIYVKMGLLDFVKAFMILWLGGVSVACIATIYSLLSTDLSREGGFFIFIPFIMLLAGILMVTFGFKVESKKSITDLEQILSAKIVEQ